MVVVRGGCAAARAHGPGERICAPAAADAGRAPGRGAPRFAAGEENMETSYRELKCKDVVNVADGRNLGRTCDIVFTFPEGQVFGIAVPEGFPPERFLALELVPGPALANARVRYAAPFGL